MIWILAAFFFCANLCLFKINDDSRLFNFANSFVLFGASLACIVFPILCESGYIEVHYFSIVFYYLCVLSTNFMVKIGYANSVERSSSVRQYNNHALTNSAWILLIIGIIALYLFTLAFGGYRMYLNNGAFALRIGHSKVTNKWSFLQPFCEFPLISLLVFLRDISRQRKISTLVGLVISCVMCYLVLMANKARMALIIYCLVILFSLCDILIQNKMRNYIVKSFSLGISASSVVLISQLLGRGAGATISSTLSNGVKFVFNNFFYWFDNISIGNCRLFFDYLVSPVYLLPSRIWSSLLGIQTISDINTFLQSGGHKGTLGITGETPVDYYTCAYCQAGILGNIVVGYFTGKLLKKLNNIASGFNDSTLKSIFEYYIIFELILRSFTNGDPEAVITRMFPLICFIIVYRVLIIKKS